VLEKKGQIVATVAQIQWCLESENAISSMNSNPFALQEWSETNVSQLQQLTELVRGNLHDLQRKVIVALVTTDVHARDIIDEMRDDKVSSVFDFKWVK
jgi:dynein heavy chain